MPGTHTCQTRPALQQRLPPISPLSPFLPSLIRSLLPLPPPPLLPLPPLSPSSPFYPSSFPSLPSSSPSSPFLPSSFSSSLLLLQFPECKEDELVSVACLNLTYSVTIRLKKVKDEKQDNLTPVVLRNIPSENGSEEEKERGGRLCVMVV